MSQDVKALIRAAKLPEATVPLCLQADLVAEFEQAERELAEAQNAPRASLGDGGRVREIAERIEALRERMLTSTVDFRLRAMPRWGWRAFVAEHPPRRDPESGGLVEQDKYLGVNVTTFFDALIRASAVGLDDDDWRVLLGDSEAERARLTAEGREDEIEEGKLTDRQYDRLADAAWGLNREDLDIPFSPDASRILRVSAPA